MTWSSDSPNANFSLSNVSTLWLPLNPDYLNNNVENQNDLIKIIIDLINFRLDFLYNVPPTMIKLKLNNNQNKKLINKQQQSKQQQQQLNYLFHYIDQTTIVLEQYFDRIDYNDHDNRRRYRYVIFANLGNETIIRDFSDKFHFSLIQLATNINRTSEFLIMKSLQLEPGEAMIATVE